MTNTVGATAERYSYARNVHGDISLLIGDTGAAKASYGYTPYGDEDGNLTKGDSGKAGSTNQHDPLNPFRFNDKRYDTGSGSIDMGARRFGPDTGRFLQRDLYHNALDDLDLATDPLTSNRYGFAGGNPISFVETDGHRPSPCKRKVNVTFAAYKYMPAFDRNQISRNACWRFERVVQGGPKPGERVWAIYNYKDCTDNKKDTPCPSNPAGRNWVFDDTGFGEGHTEAKERRWIIEAASSHSGLGYVFMAPRRGGCRSDCWRRPNLPKHVRVTRYYAQLYDSETDPNSLINVWKKNRSVGVPMLNINNLLSRRRQLEAQIHDVCSIVRRRGGHMSFYVNERMTKAKMDIVASALTRCTRSLRR